MAPTLNVTPLLICVWAALTMLAAATLSQPIVSLKTEIAPTSIHAQHVQLAVVGCVHGAFELHHVSLSLVSTATLCARAKLHARTVW